MENKYKKLKNHKKKVLVFSREPSKDSFLNEAET